jgi:hypothetical protein
VKHRLGNQFDAFEQIIKFARNVLNHAMTSNIKLKKDDFIHQKTFLTNEMTDILHFDFTYSKYFKERK